MGLWMRTSAQVKSTTFGIPNKIAVAIAAEQAYSNHGSPDLRRPHGLGVPGQWRSGSHKSLYTCRQRRLAKWLVNGGLSRQLRQSTLTAGATWQPLANLPYAVFTSPSKPLSRPNPFANLSTPIKSHLPPPQTSSFTPQLPSRASAPAFRNPAFTTPRKPFDELVLSEASGAEDSPALTEVSDFPNDTPETDRMGDVIMGGALSPSKIDKTLRYGKNVLPPKKHSSGRGDIRGNRELSAADLLRKRKRHNLDKDVGSVARYRGQGWDDSDADSDNSIAPPLQSRSRSKKNKAPPKGVMAALFHMLDEHPNAPDNLFRWIKFLVNFFLISIFAYIGWAIVDTVRGDIRSANEEARLELIGKMARCQNQYTVNECSTKVLPALEDMCNEWSECMMQNPESIMRVKVTAKQIAEIINEFSEAMNLKAWVRVARGSAEELQKLTFG